MSADAREALRRLVASLEEHLEAAATRRGPADAAVDDAYESVATAFEQYEEALDAEFAETLPLVLDDESFDEDEDDDEDEDEEDEDDDSEDDALDAHAVEDEDDLDDDLDEFDLR